VVNITHPVLGLPAVYFIVPGAFFRERAVGSNVPLFAAKILAEQDDAVVRDDELKYLERLYPGSYFIKFYEGRSLAEAGRSTDATHSLIEALNMNPTREDAAGILTYLGLAFKDLEEYDRAIDALTRSAAIDPDRRDTFNLLGFCYFKTKEHAKAIQAFEQVLKLDPGSGIDYANIGANYRELGQIDDAVRYFRIALEIDPSLDWVKQNLAGLT
jgi:ribosomal protein S12 methylthiotransferase accessory factor